MLINIGNINGGSPAPTASVIAPQRARVALVCMPWNSTFSPSLAMALLKTYERDAGWTPDLHYLNIRLARRIGVKRYEAIVGQGAVCIEWFFAQELFGPRGTGEIDNTCRQLIQNPAGRAFLNKLRSSAELSLEELDRLASYDVPAFIDDCL